MKPEQVRFNMRQEVRSRLLQYAEEEYRDFSAALIPGAKRLLGVRLPRLREIAKELAKGDWRGEIESAEGECEDVWFEETMLRGMVIGYGTAKSDVTQSEGIRYFEEFVPMIRDWSVCDSFCSSFTFANRHRDAMWETLQRYLYSDREFEVRVSLIMLLNQYLKYDIENRKRPRNKRVAMCDIADSFPNREISVHTVMMYPYLEKILAALNREFYQGYYAQMAAAWLFAETFVCFPYEAVRMLARDCRMDEKTRSKAIQKLRESKTPDAEVKEYLKKRDKLEKWC